MTRRLYVPLALLASGWPLFPQGLPGMAVGILQQTTLARQAVKSQDKEQALAHVREASALAKEILAQAGPHDDPLLIPVSWERETTTTYTDIKRHKAERGEADRMMKPNTNVSGAEAETTATKLNVTAAAQRLGQAESLIDGQDWEGADTALAYVLAAVQREQASTDVPLLRARLNLMLARSRVLDGKFGDATLPLREAAQALSDYEALFPGPKAEQARVMRQEILAYAREIPHKHDDAQQKIEQWLEPVNQWYDALSK